jgi:hypothetical protein
MTKPALLDRTSLSTANPARSPEMVALTRSELLGLIMTSLRQTPTLKFGGLYLVAGTPIDKLRAVKVTGTAFEPVRMALVDAGLDTGDTVGDIMDAVPLTKPEVHELICECNGSEITGADLADRFGGLDTTA